MLNPSDFEVDEERIGKIEVDPEGMANYWNATGRKFLAEIWYALRDWHIELEEANELAGEKLWYRKEDE
jgi:hypothetical protein